MQDNLRLYPDISIEPMLACTTEKLHKIPIITQKLTHLTIFDVYH